MPRLNVDLGERSYPIVIEAGALENAGFLSSIIKGKQVIIITNEVVAPLYLSLLEAQFKQQQKSCYTIVLPDGEKTKSLDNFANIMQQLLQQKVSRDACIVALGGGVVGDLSGFVAACYQRGIDFVQVPTTLLAQVDSSVGGKTAVNHALGKNMIGAFYQPKAVIIDSNTLSTLNKRDFAAGVAEVIKYGIIYSAEFFDWLEQNKAFILNKDAETLNVMIARCCDIKAKIVAQDEQERGLRALLNLGHTFGHAIEAHTEYGQILHGEAVATGMVLASRLALTRKQLSTPELRRIIDLIEFFDLPIVGPHNMQVDDYIEHMQRDKKVLSGKMRFILPIGIGNAHIVDDVSEQELNMLLG